jgi:gliding motility-associated-like protein
MKKYLFFILLFFSLHQKIEGQVNLVPNSSFENYTTCPFDYGQLYYATPWFQPNYYFGTVTTACSSEIYNTCGSFGYVSVPSNNTSGHQIPRTGEGYAGFGLRNDGAITSIEYMEVSLLSSLLAGKTYCINFYVSLSDTSLYAVSNIGAFFSNDSLLYNSPTYSNIPVIPQIENPSTNIISDKDNWTLISGQFIATGGERYMTIGNFKDNASTPIQIVSGYYPYAYYYFDDISVVCCDCDTTIITNINIPNVFTPNNDNTNDVFKITSINISSLNCKIYNRWGIIVGELKNVNDTWDGRNTSGVECTDGVYYYVLSAKGKDEKEYTKKGFVQLIR